MSRAEIIARIRNARRARIGTPFVMPRGANSVAIDPIDTDEAHARRIARARRIVDANYPPQFLRWAKSFLAKETYPG